MMTEYMRDTSQDNANDLRLVVVSGRSETGMLIAHIFASIGYRVVSVDKYGRRRTGAVYTLRQSTFDAMDAVAEGLGDKIKEQCRSRGIHPHHETTAINTPRCGPDVGVSTLEWVIRAEHLYQAIDSELNSREVSGSIDVVEGTLTPRLEDGKTKWEVVQSSEGKRTVSELVGGVTPLVVCCVEGSHGTTLESLGVSKIDITHTQYWILGVVEGGDLGNEAKLSVRYMGWEDGVKRKVSRLSDGRGRTAIHIHISDDHDPKLSQDNIDELFKRASAEICNVQSRDIQNLDIRGSNGQLGSRPSIITVKGKIARHAAFIHNDTVVAGFGDDIAASSFQTGGGVNYAIAQTTVATELATNIRSTVVPDQVVRHANKRLLEFAIYFSCVGAVEFYSELDLGQRRIQQIYGDLLTYWHQGKAALDYQDTKRKLVFLSSLRGTNWSIKYPGNGTFDVQLPEKTRTAPGVCGECGAQASLVCLRCRSQSYCDKECQKKHWYLHKKICVALAGKTWTA